MVADEVRKAIEEQNQIVILIQKSAEHIHNIAEEVKTENLMRESFLEAFTGKLSNGRKI